MITRTVVFADENGRARHTVRIEAEDQGSLEKQTANVLKVRRCPFVFTTTRDPTVEFAETGEEEGEHKSETVPKIAGFQVFEPMTRESKMAQWWGGARLNSVQARKERESVAARIGREK